jgi:hypothetical protein
VAKVEVEILEKLKAIFKVKDASYSEPSSAKEQDTLFIKIDESRHQILDTREVARVSGSCLIFSDSDKLSLGFYSKAIFQASRELKDKFFFHEFESSENIYGNIAQRSFSFVYFYEKQYDPDKGSITSVEFTEDE